MKKRTDISIDELRNVLLRHRAEVLEDESITEEARETVVADQSRVGRLSRMEALQDQAMALETERRRQIELTRIDAALKRIEDNDYGYCTACDGKIPAKRLTLDPAIPTCIKCATKAIHH